MAPSLPKFAGTHVMSAFPVSQNASCCLRMNWGIYELNCEYHMPPLLFRYNRKFYFYPYPKEEGHIAWTLRISKTMTTSADVCFPPRTVNQYRQTTSLLASIQLQIRLPGIYALSPASSTNQMTFLKKLEMDKLMASPSSEKRLKQANVFFCVFSKITMPILL
jgi:hypothetical protein